MCIMCLSAVIINCHHFQAVSNLPLCMGQNDLTLMLKTTAVLWFWKQKVPFIFVSTVAQIAACALLLMPAPQWKLGLGLSCETSITMVLHSYHDCVLCIKSCSQAKLLTFQPFSSLSDCLCFWPHRNVLKFSNHSSYLLKTVLSNPIKMRTVLCLFYSTVEFEANSKWTCVNFSNLSISPNLIQILD